MLNLVAYGQEYECNRAVKDGNTLSLYKDGTVYCKFSGISDFSGYSLKDENGNPVDFESAEPSLQEQIKILESALHDTTLSSEVTRTALSFEIAQLKSQIGGANT